MTTLNLLLIINFNLTNLKLKLSEGVPVLTTGFSIIFHRFDLIGCYSQEKNCYPKAQLTRQGARHKIDYTAKRTVSFIDCV